MSTKPVSIFTAPPNLPNHEIRLRKHMLARLAIAWLAMMQTMMFAFPGYIRGDYAGSDNVQMLDNAIIIMNWLSLILTVPVVLYCAWPVWKGVTADDRSGADASVHVNMNWPIALGIIVAFIPSAIATWREVGEVYFESICMFVAFLLTARYMEFCADQSARYLPDSLPVAFMQRKRQMASHADHIAFLFVCLQIALAVISAMVWLVMIDEHHALPILVALFVMSCPCAMSISVPTAFSAARAAMLNHPEWSTAQQDFLLEKTRRCAKQNLYGSLSWHILMTPLAMIGLVHPWLAAITMLISSLAVAFNSWLLYRRFNHLNDYHQWQAKFNLT